MNCNSVIKAGQLYNLVVYVTVSTFKASNIGKQSTRISPLWMFLRVTGVWQTVWMEAVFYYGLKSAMAYEY